MTARKGDVIRWIREHSDSLSPSQQKVAQFLIQGGLEVSHYTISRIAEQVGVNASTVVRAAQALGYEGFPEMQAALRQQFIRQARLAQRLQISSQQLLDDLHADPPEKSHVLNTVLRDEVAQMLDLPQHVPVAQFDQAVDLLDHANHVYIIGLGASFPAALNMGIVLRYIRPNITILTPGIDPIPAQLEPLAADDLIFSICFARYTRETLTTMEVGRKRGAKVITITDNPVSPAAKRADLALSVPFRLRFYGNSVVLFALTDAILGALALRYPEATQQRLERLEELYESFNLLSGSDEADT